MTRAEKVFNLAGVALPFLGVIVAIVFLWNELVSWRDLGIMAAMYVLTAMGITVGFHRLLTHRAFATSKPLEYAWAGLGSMAVQGPVIAWVADHRKHHAFSDVPGDPHSPHVDHGHGLKGALRGLLHAHVGWLFIHTQRGNHERYAPDLLRDPTIRWVNKYFFVWAIGGLLAALALGWIIGGSLHTALTGLLWGGAVRMLVLD